MLAIPDLVRIPIFKESMNELMEGVFLVFIDIKNVRLIQTGQIAKSLRNTD